MKVLWKSSLKDGFLNEKSENEMNSILQKLMPVNINYNYVYTHERRSIMNTNSENVMAIIDTPYFLHEFSYNRI